MLRTFFVTMITFGILSLATLAGAVKLEEQDLTGEYDLLRCVQQGLKLNPQMQSARHQIKSKEFLRKSAMGAFGPSASVGYGFTHNGRQPQSLGTDIPGKNVWSLNFAIEQPLFTGFRLLSTYQQAQLNEELAGSTLNNVELSLIQAIQTAYLTLLQARMDVKSAEDSVARLESQLKVTTAYYEVGLKPRLDVLEAETNLATSKQNLVVAKNTVDTQIARLNTLIGLPLENDTNYVGELVYKPFTRSMDNCLDSAYRKRPDLEIARKSVDIARKSVDIAASEFYPQVTGSWEYSQTGGTPSVQGTGESGSNEWAVGASMNWKFFEWGQTTNNVRSAKETVSQLQAELANSRLEASYEVKSNMLSLRSAEERIGVARKSIEAARESYRMAQARYQAQVGTNTDVLDAQESVTKAEAELSGALSDYETSLANLFVAMGERNLALDVQP